MWHWLLQLLIFQKLGKSGFCTCYLQESITQWCMTMVMQTWYQLKAEELLLASTDDLGYEYVYLRNSWPLNFDYLFFWNTLYIQNTWKIVRRWDHQLTHLHIHVDCSRNVSLKKEKKKKKKNIFPIFIQFTSNFHNSIEYEFCISYEMF